MRNSRYDAETEPMLALLWAAAERICAKRLVPFLPQLIEAMERHGHLALSPETRTQLLSINAATVDRILTRVRRAERAHGLSTTRGPWPALRCRMRSSRLSDSSS